MARFDVLSDSHRDSLTDLAVTVSSLSAAGALFIIFCVALSQKLRGQFVTRLIFNLSIASLFAALGNVLGSPDDESGTCIFQALLLEYFNLAVFCWVTCMAYCLYSMTVSGKNPEGKMRLFLVICWGGPLLLIFWPFIGDDYGQSGVWCWIRSTEAGKIYRFAIFYVPLWIAVAATIFFYGIVIRAQRNLSKSTPADDSGEGSIHWRLGLYPLAFILLWLPATINRVQNLVSPGNPVYELFYLHVLTTTMQGLVYSLIYGLNRTVRSELVLGGKRILSWVQRKSPSSPRPPSTPTTAAPKPIMELAATPDHQL